MDKIPYNILFVMHFFIDLSIFIIYDVHMGPRKIEDLYLQIINE
jgi:hypothetical protein